MVFYVRGRGEFPLDMLRYDQCYPLGPDDAAAIGGDTFTPFRTIVLCTSNRTFAADRWDSFGWAANEENIWAKE